MKILLSFILLIFINIYPNKLLKKVYKVKGKFKKKIIQNYKKTMKKIMLYAK